MTASPSESVPPPIFANRTALVTGGSRGIGRACCLRLARGGARVAINYRSDEAAARETARLVEAAGARSLVVQADVSVPGDVERMVREVTATLGPVDLLVNNAGVFDYVPHTEATLEIWRRTLDVNLTGTFLVTWAVKEGMVARRYGRIVNMTSISALEARPMSIAYAASKAGVVAFTKSIAAALAADNVRVNAVAPGLIETEILEGVSQQALDRIIDATPMKRIGTPDEVAALVMFLLSDESSFTTGQTIVSSGGRVMLP
ncbi:MAG TPA: SDR family NAD(P)-dependent oxidoreductase [Planctomycetaceae bacterium]|jgi:3-oxoacyl-[acyl-carrier protein] reductase|nr:SDR family NAD(P)-dependent oxidoreductase [Planctomycetaceae bacterium]